MLFSPLCWCKSARYTGKEKRAEGVTRLVNLREHIPLYESMRASRYGTVDSYLSYTEPAEDAHFRRYRGMAAKTNVAEEKKLSVSFFSLF